MEETTLYRPVGLKELELIADSNWQAFPPRLEWQPIFYPVLNLQYACQIAQEWNTQDAFSGHCGAVTRFALKTEYLQQFKIENVGSEIHNELWVPAEELGHFNQYIIGKIEVVDAYFGLDFVMTGHELVNRELKRFM